MTLDRRHSIAGIAGSAALAGCATSPSGSSAPSVAGLQAAPMPAFIGQSTQKLMPKGKAPRVVICGGGWGGLTTAANLRKLAPQVEVVLIDRNPNFFSSPLSNMWLVGMLDGELLSHDYQRASQQLGWHFVQAEVEGVNRVIYEELCLGSIKPESRRFFQSVMGRLAERGAQGIILGCTEIGLLVTPEDSPVPLFDTAEIHARSAALRALQG